ncbi:MAG: hypothetical protein AAF251_08410 [Pseudomonadota bacterium]
MKKTTLSLALCAPLSLTLLACAPQAEEIGEDGEVGEASETVVSADDEPVDERADGEDGEQGEDGDDRTGPEDRVRAAAEMEAGDALR